MKRTFLIRLILVLSLANVNLAAPGIWTQKADMPTARYCIAASEVDGKIYVIGGWDAWLDSTPFATVEVYDPVTDTWERKADMPTARGALATAVLDGKIYAIGGARGQSGFSTVEIYDPVTDAWEEGVSMSTGRWFHSAAVVNGRIYAIGGVYSTTMEEYNPDTRTWTRKASMPIYSRWVFGTGVVNGRIYAIGGDTGVVSSSVIEYDPISDSWIQKADMPTARAALGATVLNERIYCLGGSINPNSATFPAVEVYNPSTDTWEMEADMPTPRGDFAVATANGKLYAIGGYSDRICSTVDEYDPYPLVVDFNGDGIVDSIDICMMVDHWLTDDPLYDIAPRPLGDGIVDVQDLILLTEHLFTYPGAVAYWTLDETVGNTAYDSINGYNGILVGGPVWQSEGGIVDGALQLDGIDDYVSTDPVLNPANGVFSVVAWVMGGAPGQVILSQANGVRWLCTDSGASLMTELKGSGRSSGLLRSQTIISDDTWHRIGLVWDGSYRHLYIDGVEVAIDIEPLSGLESTDGGLYFGASSTLVPNTFWSGLIDDIRIYNRAINP